MHKSDCFVAKLAAASVLTWAVTTGNAKPLTHEAPTPPDPKTASQHHFDKFAWDLFVRLNWPVDDDGKFTDKVIGTDPTAMRRWEHFVDPIVLFTPKSAKAKIRTRLCALLIS